MWTCPKCKRNVFTSVCLECPPEIVKPTVSKRQRTKDDPEYWRIKSSINHYKPHLSGQWDKDDHKKAHMAREARIATDKILSDPDFDYSLAASRARLEKALAIGSETALRRAENGLCNADDAEILNKMAGMYRTLANTLPQKSLDEMSDEELTAAAGK